MSLLQQRSVFSRKLHKTKEKAQNISSKLRRLNTPHVLRDWRHVILIFMDYVQLATIGISRLLKTLDLSANIREHTGLLNEVQHMSRF